MIQTKVMLHMQREKGEHSVNAYQRKRNRAAAMVLAAAMLAAPVCAAALETAPLAPGAQLVQQEDARMQAFGRNRGFKGVTASNKWLRQARIAGMSIDLRVHTLMGAEITFQEDLGPSRGEEGAICLSLIALHEDDDLMLQLSQQAMDLLERVGITEIAVANRDREICGYYKVEDRRSVCKVLGVGRNEQLCVSGAEDPVSVVSEDGVRRMVTQ